jgi:carboxymethylenebutenolidase
MPEGHGRVPAVVLASTIHGIDADLMAIAREFAQRGYIAAAPDLFARAQARPDATQDAHSRTERIVRGERDMVDTLAHLRTLPAFNGQAAVMGFCYGGPYAILGPKRLGYAAGIACHGSQMLEFVAELTGLERPVCIMWGDDDYRAPADVLDAYRECSSRVTNVEVHVFPGVRHGYMLPKSRAFDAVARDFSMARALAILASFRAEKEARSASSPERPSPSGRAARIT